MELTTPSEHMQLGKCVTSDTKIKIRNKRTGEVKELTIKQFHDLQKAKAKRAEKKYQENEEKFRDADPSTYVECKVCGFKASVISNHLSSAHNIRVSDYKVKYSAPVSCESVSSAQRLRSNDVTNPWYGHGGKYSPFSKTSINYSPDIQKRAITHSMQSENNPYAATKIETYLRHGLSVEDAERKVAERQSTFSLQKCIEKYGEEDGREVHRLRQERWLTTMRKGSADAVG